MFHVEHRIERSSLSREEAERVRQIRLEHKDFLQEYIDRLLWWNNKINLVSRGVSRETLETHIEHSLILSTSKLFIASGKIIDTGTGGGLPGIPLAIAYPEKEFVLNDIVSKKIMACKHISAGLKLKNTIPAIGSIEGLLMDAGTLVISKHAFKINDLINMIGGRPWEGILLLKGSEEVEQELEGMEMGLNIQIKELEQGFKNTFYSGKALVEIKKQNE